MAKGSGGIVTVSIILAAFAGFGFLLLTNAEPAAPLAVVIPTEAEPTANPDALAEIFSERFGSNVTPQPTVALPTERFIPPTVNLAGEGVGQGVNPAELAGVAQVTQAAVSVGVTPTPVPPTPTLLGDGNQDEPAGVVVMQGQQEIGPDEWQPPPMPVPQSRDPLGRDHYVLARPVESNANSYGLFYYPYGSNGTQQIAISRVHHGIDFSNPVGTPIRSVAPGEVIFSSEDGEDILPGSPSYGVVVVIEHDFGWQGNKIQTLYAHLDRTLVRKGDRVETGTVIALSGNSGRSSGPHLHFEVRLGDEATQGMLTYGDTYNPTLWIVPYYGHGTIVGQLVDRNGDFVDDVFVTARSLTTGEVYTTSTYSFDGTINQVNSDPNWRENFVLGDIPQGRYEVIASYESQRVSEVVQVFEGATAFVALQPIVVPTAQPVESP